MPRKGPAPKRPVVADPVYGSPVVSQLVNKILVDGKKGLAERIDVRCFKSNPSIKSSLAFLRKTPWAREKVEQLYVKLQRKA